MKAMWTIHSKFQPPSTTLLSWQTVPLTPQLHPLYSKRATYLPPTRVLDPSILLITLHRYLTFRYTLLPSTKPYSFQSLLKVTTVNQLIAKLLMKNFPSASRADWLHQQVQLLSESRPTHSITQATPISLLSHRKKRSSIPVSSHSLPSHRPWSASQLLTSLSSMVLLSKLTFTCWTKHTLIGTTQQEKLPTSPTKTSLLSHLGWFQRVLPISTSSPAPTCKSKSN